MEPTSVNVLNYSGGPLKLTQQLKAKVTIPGQKTIESYLQVQSKPPVKLLLGSDILKQQAFMFLKPKGDGTTIDLLHKKRRKVTRSLNLMRKIKLTLTLLM